MWIQETVEVEQVEMQQQTIFRLELQILFCLFHSRRATTRCPTWWSSSTRTGRWTRSWCWRTAWTLRQSRLLQSKESTCRYYSNNFSFSDFFYLFTSQAAEIGQQTSDPNTSIKSLQHPLPRRDLIDVKPLFANQVSDTTTFLKCSICKNLSSKHCVQMCTNTT